nr:PREDICTED: interleukin-6 receptor subunit beta-like isoform X2 [Latimeria chalumnae]|eukprot:XP_014339436.1 PREDICTED: interleukin-6 receptor subunit beta-like isoform X2 [Latimeria chalumnae]
MLSYLFWVPIGVCIFLAKGLTSCGYVVPTSIVVESGSNVTVFCILEKDCILREENANQIIWKQADVQVPQKYYTVVNATVSSVTIVNFTLPKTDVICRIKDRRAYQILGKANINSGVLPEKPRNITCVYYHRKSFTCNWDPGKETHLPTTYTLIKEVNNNNKTCQDKNNSCTFHFPNIEYDADHVFYVKAKNDLGMTVSDPVAVNSRYAG